MSKNAYCLYFWSLKGAPLVSEKQTELTHKNAPSSGEILNQ